MNNVKRIKALLNKDTAFDIFQDLNFAQEKTIDYSKLINYKNNRLYKSNQFNKIKILLNMRAVQHILFLKLAIAKIKIAKSLFVLDLEQGNEVFIHKDISQ